MSTPPAYLISPTAYQAEVDQPYFSPRPLLLCTHTQRPRNHLQSPASICRRRAMISMELSSLVIWSQTVLVAVLVALATPLLYNLWLAFLRTCWKPLRIQRRFAAQGIPSAPFHFVYGNFPELNALVNEARRHPMPQVSHDVEPHILPHTCLWAQKYGPSFVYWLGSYARYTLVNVEDVKDVLSTKFGHYPKPDQQPDTEAFLGNGLLSSEGEHWVQHRRILSPAFFMEKLKSMIPTMEACTNAMTENWGTLIETEQAIDVHKMLKDLTADIIAHTAFGSSFLEGKEVFRLQNQQQVLMDQRLRTVYLPGARFLPSAANRQWWKIDRGIKCGLLHMIKIREESIKCGQGDSYGNDLLGLMMAANQHTPRGNTRKSLAMDIDDIIDECKTFFFAGHETTASLLSWTFLLLATNPEWQTRTREEVLAVCGATGTPTADTINHLKLMGMVLNEALRLYPPAALMIRKAGKDMQLGKVIIPQGVQIVVPILSWHHDERYWGADAHEFRPERFSEGVAKASKVAGAFMPFSMGPRVCIGQNFALLEAKVVLSTILRRFRFHLSPSYQHAPVLVLTLQPQFGMPIVFEEL